MRKITVAKSAGFCFGVDRAVNLVEKLLDDGKKVATLGPIIHNPQMVEMLSQRGVVIVDDENKTPDGSVLVIRSHGVSREVEENITAAGLECCNATCPFVLKIHRIVNKNSSADIPVLIAGDENHAEVIGIIGHCNGKVYCFKSREQLEDIIKSSQINAETPICVVAQTTFNAKIWSECKKKLKKVYTNAKIFDTICDATELRQSEAQQLAEQSDLMVVVGGRHSSNTKKLFDLCSEKCKTVLVESADELLYEDIASAQLVGLTAGASTPAVIIKEVLNTMTEIINQETQEILTEETGAAQEKSFEDMTFEEQMESYLDKMNTDQRVKGIVQAVNPGEVRVDIGRKYTGIVPADEISNDPSLRPEDVVKVGDEIDLIVMRTNDQEGIITLSKRRYDAQAGFSKIADAKESQEILEGTVTAVVKGGVTVICEGIRVFVPASHATLSRNESLEDLVGTQVKFRVIDIRRGRSVVGSIRSVLKEQKKAEQEAFWSSVEVGATYTGTVKSLTSYGAFVDLGGVDGMIHITELSWTRIKHPSEVVKEGDVVEVYVKDIDTEKHKISLGFKKAEDNPWEVIKTKYSVGDVVSVKIVSFATYGAFANVMPGIDGLIHISQIADRRIEKPQDVLKAGDVVDAKITDINYETKRVSLSIRALIEKEEVVEEVEDAATEDEIVATTEE